MSEVKCGSLILKRGVGKDMHLSDIMYEISFSQPPFAETVKLVEAYLKREGLRRGVVSLKFVNRIRSEGDIVSPAFTGGPTTSVREPVISLAFSITHYNNTTNEYTITPIGTPMNLATLRAKVIGEALTPYIAFYLPLPSIYPFTIIRFYKILYAGDTAKLASLLRTLYLMGRSGDEYKNVEQLLATTSKKLKIPRNPTIQFIERKYYVVYRCQRSFASVVIEPKTIDYLCKLGNGILIDHHAVILEVNMEEPAFYYSAILNYMLYKVTNNDLGALIRNQFTRPLRALTEAGLGWNEEKWQYDVAELSKTLTSMFRSCILEHLGLPKDIRIAELVDRGLDIKVKQSRDRVESASEVVFNSDAWREIVKLIDEKIDEKMLLESLRKWVVEKRERRRKKTN
jgi:hypothetical protein